MGASVAGAAVAGAAVGAGVGVGPQAANAMLANRTTLTKVQRIRFVFIFSSFFDRLAIYLHSISILSRQYFTSLYAHFL
jgi:hypothetical protein